VGKVYSALVLEQLESSHGADQKGGGFESKLQLAMAKEKARRTLANADAEFGAAMQVQAVVKGTQTRKTLANKGRAKTLSALRAPLERL